MRNNRLPAVEVVTSADYDGLRRPWVLASRAQAIPTLCIEHGFLAPIPQPEVMKPEFRRHLAYASDFVNLDNEIEVGAARQAHAAMRPEATPPEFLAHGTPQWPLWCLGMVLLIMMLKNQGFL